MTIYKFPKKEMWPHLLTRPVIDHSVIDDKVNVIFNEVKKNGDKALRKFTSEFDKADIQKLEVSDQEKYFALNQVDPLVFDAIKLAAQNITVFHKKQLQP